MSLTLMPAPAAVSDGDGRRRAAGGGSGELELRCIAIIWHSAPQFTACQRWTDAHLPPTCPPQGSATLWRPSDELETDLVRLNAVDGVPELVARRPEAERALGSDRRG